MPAELVRLRPGLLASALALNNAHVPMVNRLRAAELSALARQAVTTAVVADGTQVVGMVLALPAHARYGSPNFRWFAARYRRFVYIDRVAIVATHRGRGIARQLYETVFTAAGSLPVVCEVNLLPPNPGSLAFHRRLGFRAIGRAWNPAARKQVVFLLRPPTMVGGGR